MARRRGLSTFVQTSLLLLLAKRYYGDKWLTYNRVKWMHERLWRFRKVEVHWHTVEREIRRLSEAKLVERTIIRTRDGKPLALFKPNGELELRLRDLGVDIDYILNEWMKIVKGVAA